MLHWKRKYTRD